MNFNRPLILASNSPRRQQLLQEAGFTFTVKTLHTDEVYPGHLSPNEIVRFLAQQKAKGFKSSLTNEVVLAADTIVVLEGEILGKPANADQAREMLTKLSGKQHEVITGVCICDRTQEVIFDEVTEVTFKPLSIEEIEYYITTHKPYDKAGAYGIQEWIGMIGIHQISGSYFNVMGLPINRVYENLLPFDQGV